MIIYNKPSKFHVAKFRIICLLEKDWKFHCHFNITIIIAKLNLLLLLCDHTKCFQKIRIRQSPTRLFSICPWSPWMLTISHKQSTCLEMHISVFYLKKSSPTLWQKSFWRCCATTQISMQTCDLNLSAIGKASDPFQYITKPHIIIEHK